MPMLLLDTNAVIYVINGRKPIFRERFLQALQSGLPMEVPIIALFELRFGIAKSDRREESLMKLKAFFEFDVAISEFTEDDAIEAADIRADLERKGAPIGAYDILIAAQARRRAATLVTANGREFQRVPELKVESWD
jgi:tRNA(fMet)-specific endonuclease VapC